MRYPFKPRPYLDPGTAKGLLPFVIPARQNHFSVIASAAKQSLSNFKISNFPFHLANLKSQIFLSHFSHPSHLHTFSPFSPFPPFTLFALLIFLLPNCPYCGKMLLLSEESRLTYIEIIRSGVRCEEAQKT